LDVVKNSITLKAIANQVGVSIATVSRTLNDLPGVNPDVRDQILKTASELGYTPNLAARGLATSITQTVGFVVHQSRQADFDDPFYPEIMEGAEAYLSQHEYHILLATVDDYTLSHPQDYPLINKGLVDGLILAGPEISPFFTLSLLSANLPLILVDNILTQTSVNCVLNDDAGGSYVSARHLMDHGRLCIAFLSGPKDWVSSRERWRGYTQAMSEAGLEPRVLFGNETTIQSGEELMAQALDRWPDVEAVCAVNDSVAIGAIRAASRLGRKVPEDLAVIGFDDVSWAKLNQPPLSTVHVYKRRVGQLAAQHLLESIKSPGTPPAKVIVSTGLVLRASCGRHDDTG
jgi:DNA-binding LacI/PurR family transcriptional regulator